MEYLLRLKSGIESLNKHEFMNIIDSYDKEYITDILFRYFNHQLNHAESVSDIIPEINTFNSKIRQTIISRDTNSVCQDEDEEEFEQIVPIQFDSLPPVMISSISSFLPFKDVLNLEKCSKSVFIGTRSPISTYQLHSPYPSKLIKYLIQNSNVKCISDSFHWNRFRNIKSFDLNFTDYFNYDEKTALYVDYAYKLKNVHFWNDLEILNIDSDFDTGPSDFNHPGREVISEFFTDLSSLNLHNVKTLNIEKFMDNLVDDEMNDVMNDILSHTVSLEFAKFDCAYHLTRPFPHTLKGIAIADITHGYVREGFDCISSNVESLHLTRYEYSGFFNQGIKLNNLKEICIMLESQDEMDLFNEQNLNCLERIHINCRYLKPENEIDNKFQKSMVQFFKATCTNVNYISIKADANMNIMINILSSALKETVKESMKIRLYNMFVDDDVLLATKETNRHLLELINILKNQTTDFMIIGKLNIPIDDEIILNTLKDTLCVNSCKEYGRYKKYSFVVSNKGCRIEGYQEKWLMNCGICELSRE